MRSCQARCSVYSCSVCVCVCSDSDVCPFIDALYAPGLVIVLGWCSVFVHGRNLRSTVYNNERCRVWLFCLHIIVAGDPL